MRLNSNGVKHSRGASIRPNNTYFLTVKATVCIMDTCICVGFTTDKLTGIIKKQKQNKTASVHLNLSVEVFSSHTFLRKPTTCRHSTSSRLCSLLK